MQVRALALVRVAVGLPSGGGRLTRGHPLCRILGVTKMLQWDGNSATFAPKCDQSEAKDKEAGRARLRKIIGVGPAAERRQVRNPRWDFQPFAFVEHNHHHRLQALLVLKEFSAHAHKIV